MDLRDALMCGKKVKHGNDIALRDSFSGCLWWIDSNGRNYRQVPVAEAYLEGWELAKETHPFDVALQMMRDGIWMKPVSPDVHWWTSKRADGSWVTDFLLDEPSWINPAYFDMQWEQRP